MVYSYRNIPQMKSFKSIPIKLKYNPITIKEPYKPDVKMFDDTEDFTRYFRANEELFKEASNDPDKPAKFLTTNKLNRTYKIPGYRIRIVRKGTDNEELTLVKDYNNRNTVDEEEASDDNATIERIRLLEDLVNRLSDQVNNIEAFLLQLKR